jgi:hypothetical protein
MNDFDEFPLYDPLIKADTFKLSSVWLDSIATNYQTLITYLTSGGVFFPQLTQAQINVLENPLNGQNVYNSTTGKQQYYSNGSWISYP